MAGALGHVRPFLLARCLHGRRHWPFLKVPGGSKIAFEPKEVTRQPMKRPRRIPKVAREVFRVDAKAEKDLIAIGGWEVGQEGKTEDARWFSMELTRRKAP